MNTDRRAILLLIALGRISPREAERLLAVCPDNSEVFWALAACFGVALLALPPAHELLRGLVHCIRAVLPATGINANQALSFLAHLLGGAL